jgi:hypothetical protein
MEIDGFFTAVPQGVSHLTAEVADLDFRIAKEESSVTSHGDPYRILTKGVGLQNRISGSGQIGYGALMPIRGGVSYDDKEQRQHNADETPEIEAQEISRSPLLGAGSRDPAGIPCDFAGWNHGAVATLGPRETCIIVLVRPWVDFGEAFAGEFEELGVGADLVVGASALRADLSSRQ